MKHLHWIFPVLLVVSALLTWRFWILGSFIQPADVMGLTQQEVQQRYGDPHWIVDDDEQGNAAWVYYHGLRGSSLRFEKGEVVEVFHRTR